MGYEYSKIQERSLGRGKTDLHFNMTKNLSQSNGMYLQIQSDEVAFWKSGTGWSNGL